MKLTNDINNYNNIYENELLYILNYINGKILFDSYGILTNLNEIKIMHRCNTDPGSSSSPIILLTNNKVIGMHYRGSKHNNNYNFGILHKKPILEYIKINEENIKLKKEIKKTNEDNIK